MIITRNAVFIFWHLSFIVSTSKNASTREISKPTAAKQQRQGLRTGNNFPSASLASVVTCIATNAPIPLCLTVKDSRNKVKKERRKLRKTPDPLFFSCRRRQGGFNTYRNEGIVHGSLLFALVGAEEPQRSPRRALRILRVKRNNRIKSREMK